MFPLEDVFDFVFRVVVSVLVLVESARLFVDAVKRKKKLNKDIKKWRGSDNES